MSKCPKCDGENYFVRGSKGKEDGQCLDCGQYWNQEESGNYDIKKVNELRSKFLSLEQLPVLRNQKEVELEHTMYIEVNPPRAGGTYIDVANWSRKYQKDIEAQIYNAIRKLGFQAKIKIKVNY